MAILLRNTKGSELTFTEVDNNFSTLLFDVALAGNNLIFYRNDGNNIVKRTINLSAISSSDLEVKFNGGPTGGVTNPNAVQILNFTGGGITVTQDPTNPSQANVSISTGSGSSGTNPYYTVRWLWWPWQLWHCL